MLLRKRLLSRPDRDIERPNMANGAHWSLANVLAKAKGAKLKQVKIADKDISMQQAKLSTKLKEKVKSKRSIKKIK